MAGSTVLAAVDQLVELIRRHELAPADSVFYSPPPIDKQGTSAIFVGEWRPADVTDASLKVDRRRREERYDVDVVCAAIVEGGSQRDADAVALGFVRAVDETVADNPVVNGAALESGQQIVSALVTGWAIDGRGPFGDSGCWCRFVVTVRVHARLL